MHIVKTLLIGLALSAVLSMSAAATTYKIESSIEANAEKVSTITIELGEKILSEDKLFGPRDIKRMEQELQKRVQRRLEKEGLFSEDGGATLIITLVHMTSNRPTMFEMAQRVGLSFNSFSLGGAEVEARLISSNGADLGKMKYAYKETQLYGFSIDQPTWYSAKHAFDLFARKLSRDLKVVPAS